MKYGIKMNKIWSFLNSQLVSAIIAGLLILIAGKFLEDSQREQDSELITSLDLQSKKVALLDNELASLKQQMSALLTSMDDVSTSIHTQPKSLLSDNNTETWVTLLSTSWAKKKYRIDVAKYSDSNENISDFYVNVDRISKGVATLRISSKDGQDIKVESLKVGSHMEFEYKNRKLRVNLLSTRQAGFWNSLAAYFSVEILE